MGAEAFVGSELDGFKPELGRGIIAIDVDVRRLVAFVRKEVEAVWSDRCDSRHGVG
jgi:hypothetical protein